MGDLGAIESDVDFDFGVADGLIAAFNAAAVKVDGQAGSRATYVRTGLTDFKGHFSEVFRTNGAIAAGDGVELGNRLREVATAAQLCADSARAEQQRREKARAWKKEHDERGNLDKIGDFLTGGDDPPVGPPEPEPTPPVSAPVNRSRQTPTSGSGGGGGGTSSAQPSKLRSFATSSGAANDELRVTPIGLRLKYASFQASCHWGTFEATGVLTGFDKWLSANDEDVRWATAVAAAFTAAGGDGNVSTLSNSALAAALKAANVDASRQDLTIEPPQAYGFPTTSGYADDPVNTATGNFVERESDLVFPGAAASLSWARCYNSADPSTGAFGPGWSSYVSAGLTFDATEGTARLTLPDGRLVVFPRLGQGWDRAVGESLWLTSEPDGLRIAGNDGAWWQFAADGRALAHGTGPEADGNVVRLARDDEGRLVGLVHGRGRSIDLVWGAVGSQERIVTAISSDGRRVEYRYDGDGFLTAASGPLGTRSYRWTEPLDGGPRLVAAVVDADGVVEVDNTYDEQGRVATQRSPFGRVTRFAYLPGRVTVASDEDGSRSNTWIADERGRLVGVVDADEHRQSTSYDRYGNPVLVTERDGATTVHEYDDRGRRLRTVTPSGADLSYGYDDADRVTTVVTEEGAVTTYTYEADQRNPSTITDPEGGLTDLAWSDGLLQRVTDPTGVVVRFGYDEHGDLTSVTDADDNQAVMERDGLGRVTAAVTPSGQRTTFCYDPATGLVVSRTDPDGAVRRYEHSAAGRLSAVVDPMGARTSVEHGSHGEDHRSVDPLGRAVSRTLDDLGNLAAVELPDGSSWRFVHDALSRLTETTDPTGAVWRSEFDRVGQRVATIDPTGVRTGVNADQAAGQVQVDDGQGDTTTTGFDPLGRVTSLGQVDGSAAVLVYDRCGRPVEALDPEGGLTRVERDAAGRPVKVTSPAGAVTTFGYDRCGRLITATDPLGASTTVGYDVDGHPVEQTSPTGEVARTRYDACGRVVEQTQPGTGTHTYAYDACGRVVESRDPQSGRRRFSYDPAGQLVSVIDGNASVTRYGYDALGRAVEITNPVGGVIRREFDGMNRCVAETDPLGRTTRAGYDGAGRLLWQTDPDGHTTSWTYDAAGRPLTMAVDGRTLSTLTRDLRNRTVTVEDQTQDQAREHVLEWNRRGQLVRRSRDGREVSWAYDADGRRTAMTTPDGLTTRYGCDAAGRVASVEHPLLGRASFDRDASGRVVAATAGGLIQSWEHANGWVVGHNITDGEGSARTAIERDADGRVTAVTHDELTTRYGYDGAGQLTEARTGSSTATWRYDPAGRLTAESVDEATREHVYDLAGQLLATTGSEGQRVSYAYDGSGRRTTATDSRGGYREFAWSATGYLASVTDHAGDQVRRTSLQVDALGELAGVDGAEFFWDTAAYAGAPVLAGDVSVVSAGAATGIGGEWSAPGWRTARSTGADPWSLRSAPGVNGVAGVQIGASGEVSVAGLEWMGARVYDPTSRGFLSVDPLDPVVGAGWAGNPYAFAGNDPVHALDPRGLKPLTDAELKAYSEGNGLGGWVKNNWEYIAGGAMVVAGGALMITGVGGPAGAMLISAGADTIIQKATTGEVNWGEVGVSFAAGAVGGGFAAAKLGATGVRGAVVAGAASGAVGGAATGGYQYATGPGPHTVGGFAGATARGGATGAAFGGVGGAASHGVATAAGKTLAHTPFMPKNPGPLSDDLAGTFSGGRYTTSVTETDRVLYRAGTEDRPLGQFFSNEPPVGVTQTRIDKAIPPSWPDGTPAPLDTGHAVRIPAGTTIHTGEVANQGGLYMGGTEQVVVEKPWLIDGVEAVDSWPLN